MKTCDVENGMIVKDRITGIEGVVMVIAHYYTGCVHVDQQLGEENIE